MNVTADTNVLVRVVVEDDAGQAARARQALRAATTLAVSNAALCEFAWVLGRGYRYSRAEIAASIELLLAAGNVAADRLAVESGLRFLRAGVDFADGIIAHEGQRLGAELFLSFDGAAVRAAHEAGLTASIPLDPA